MDTTLDDLIADIAKGKFSFEVSGDGEWRTLDWVTEFDSKTFYFHPELEGEKCIFNNQIYTINREISHFPKDTVTYGYADGLSIIDFGPFEDLKLVKKEISFS